MSILMSIMLLFSLFLLVFLQNLAMQTKKIVFEHSLPAERYKENSSYPRACPNTVHSS